MKPILLDFPIPILTPRLILRPPQIGDGMQLNAAVLESLEMLKKFMPWVKEIPTINDSEEFVRLSAANWILKKNDEPYLPIFIFDKVDQKLLGCTGYHHFDWEIPSLETGYWLRSNAIGQGFMTEAINALTQYAFKELNVKRISISCEISNQRSKKIPERLGFIQEATLKGNRRNLITQEITDTLIYARYDLNDLPNLSVEWNKKSDAF